MRYLCKFVGGSSDYFEAPNLFRPNRWPRKPSDRKSPASRSSVTASTTISTMMEMKANTGATVVTTRGRPTNKLHPSVAAPGPLSWRGFVLFRESRSCIQKLFHSFLNHPLQIVMRERDWIWHLNNQKLVRGNIVKFAERSQSRINPITQQLTN